MLSEREVSAAIGSTAYGADGDKLGTVEHFFVDDRTGAPTWVAVTTGLFGTRQSLVPVQSASFDDGRLLLPVSREAVRSSPGVGDGRHLDPDDEAQLRRHYGLEVGGAGRDAARGEAARGETTGRGAEDRHDVPPTDGDQEAAGRYAVGQEAVPPTAAGDDTLRTGAVPPVPDEAGRHAAPSGAEGAMTRSEERLQVGTEQVAARRVRLVKYVVTEDVQITVPIRREEFRLEEIPLDAGGPAGDLGAGESLVPASEASGGLPDEIVLHTERPVVSVEVVPVERVRLRTEMVQGSEQVTERVQREQIVVDQDRLPGTRG